MLQSENADTRFYAAYVFSRWPGEIPAAAIAELGDNLKLAGLQDPHYYDPVEDKEQNTTYMRDGEKLFDNARRYEALSSLARIGADAKDLIPQIQVVAQSTDDPQLRRSALLAIGKIDPDLRQSDPALDQALTTVETGRRLAERAQTPDASVDELIKGLQYQESAQFAARALEKAGDPSEAAIQGLQQAVQTLGSYDAAHALAKLAPDKLVDLLGVSNSTKAWGPIAQVIQELGPAAPQGTLPKLVQVLEHMDEKEIGVRGGLANAILAIDPRAPKPLFNWDDLHPAVQALDAAAEAAGDAVYRKVMDLQIRKFQDLNQKTRGEVLAFSDALAKVDQRAYAAFTIKLAALNPSLRDALPH
jgi:hypothetical protein